MMKCQRYDGEGTLLFEAELYATHYLEELSRAIRHGGEATELVAIVDPGGTCLLWAARGDMWTLRMGSSSVGQIFKNLEAMAREVM